jgi:hypothetical protein
LRHFRRPEVLSGPSHKKKERETYPKCRGTKHTVDFLARSKSCRLVSQGRAEVGDRSKSDSTVELLGSRTVAEGPLATRANFPPWSRSRSDFRAKTSDRRHLHFGLHPLEPCSIDCSAFRRPRSPLYQGQDKVTFVREKTVTID